MPRLRALVIATAVSALAIGVAAPAFADDVLQVSAPSDPTVGGSYVPSVTGGDNSTVTLTAASSTTPATCSIADDGMTVDFDHAGSCTVNASDTSGETGSATFTIGKAAQTIDFTPPTGGTIGDTETLTATSSSGLDVSFSSLTTDVCTVTGNQVSYDHAGTCTVAADQAGSDDYLPAGQVTHDVVLPKLDQSIDFTGVPTDGQVGDTQTLSATSDSNLAVTFESTTTDVCSVNGDTVSFEHVGTCTVGAIQVGNDDYNAADEQYSSADVAKGDQTITVAPAVPTEFGLHGAYVVNLPSPDISASSGLFVKATVDPSTTNNGLGQACSITTTSSSFTISADHAGTCVVDLDQAGNDDYTAAPQVQLQITVDMGNQRVDLSAVTGSTRSVGSTYTLPATTVQGHDVTLRTFSGACTIDATTDTLTLVHTGNCDLFATASGDADYNALQTKSLPTIEVTKGASSVTVVTTPTTINATVRQSTGSGADLTPGSVKFVLDGTKKLGTVQVGDNGRADLTYRVPVGATHVVTATYTGSADLTSTDKSYTRRDPKITVASVKSSVAKTKYGWYRKPVTTTFACSKGSSKVTSCTEPVTLTANGKHRAVTGKAAAADGGASSTTTYVNIDGTAPKVSVSGPANGAVYVGKAPAAKCVASDALSGIATCALRVEPHANGVFTYAASAIDKAGNTSRVTGTYRVQNRYIRDAFFDDSTNSYYVTAGSRITLVALAPTRPRYLLPVYASNTPHVAGHTFFHDGRQANSPRWSLGVTLPKSMSGHTFWALGIKVGNTVYKVKVRVTN